MHFEIVPPAVALGFVFPISSTGAVQERWEKERGSELICEGPAEQLGGWMLVMR